DRYLEGAVAKIDRAVPTNLPAIGNSAGLRSLPRTLRVASATPAIIAQRGLFRRLNHRQLRTSCGHRILTSPYRSFRRWLQTADRCGPPEGSTCDRGSLQR